jgi:hypothetical protein
MMPVYSQCCLAQVLYKDRREEVFEQMSANERNLSCAKMSSKNLSSLCMGQPSHLPLFGTYWNLHAKKHTTYLEKFPPFNENSVTNLLSGFWKTWHWMASSLHCTFIMDLSKTRVDTTQLLWFPILFGQAILHICFCNFSSHKIAKLSLNNLISYKLTHLGNSKWISKSISFQHLVIN